MHHGFYFYRSKINSYKIFYPTILSLILLLLAIFYALRAFLNCHHAEADYSALLKKEEGIRTYLSSEEVQQLQTAKEKELAHLESLSQCLRKYQIALPEERLLITAEQFQDQLQKDILIIQEKAKRNAVIVPPSFFSGLSEYEKMTPSAEEINKLRKQEAALFWIACHLAEYNHLKILQFHFENKAKKLELIKAEKLGELTLMLSTDEASFQNLFNKIVNSPYYFVIEKLVIENSNSTGPVHSLENKDAAIKIVLGREKLNVLMIIKIIDFTL